MKRNIGLLSLAFLATCIGCNQDFYTKSIVESKTIPRNLIAMELVGSGEQLQKRGTIDIHRTFAISETVEIDTWVINAKTNPAQGTAILLHGTDESKANYLGIGKNLAAMGYDVVLIDLRSHGRSTGKYITYGAKEKLDVKTIVDALIDEKKITAKPLYVFGVTLGGATAIQYAAIEPNVAGIVVVAPWKDTASAARRKLFLAGLTMSEEEFQKILADSGKLADFDPLNTSAVNDAGKLKCPVYIIHGLLDMAVPVSDSEAIIAQIKGPKKLKIIMPGPEQAAIGIGWEKWIPEQIDMVAKGKLKAIQNKSGDAKPKPLKIKTEAKEKPADTPNK